MGIDRYVTVLKRGRCQQFSPEVPKGWENNGDCFQNRFAILDNERNTEFHFTNWRKIII